MTFLTRRLFHAILIRSLPLWAVAILPLGVVVLALPPDSSGGEPAAATTPSHSRTFLFTYGATVTGLTPGQTARLWLPVPPSNADQEVNGGARTSRDGKSVPAIPSMATRSCTSRLG